MNTVLIDAVKLQALAQPLQPAVLALRRFETAFRNAIARGLLACARGISRTPATEAGLPPSARTVANARDNFAYESHRPEVRVWCENIPADLLAALETRGLAPARLQSVLHHVKYLPNYDTALEFVNRVPNWYKMHHKFSAFLLRRLVSCHYRGCNPDTNFAEVKAWLERRSRVLTAMPDNWYEAVDAARCGLGDDLGLLARAPADQMRSHNLATTRY